MQDLTQQTIEHYLFIDYFIKDKKKHPEYGTKPSIEIMNMGGRVQFSGISFNHNSHDSHYSVCGMQITIPSHHKE